VWPKERGGPRRGWVVCRHENCARPGCPACHIKGNIGQVGGWARTFSNQGVIAPYGGEKTGHKNPAIRCSMGGMGDGAAGGGANGRVG